MKIVTHNAAETRKLAQLLAKEALQTLRGGRLPHALVFSLEGTLGSGKTTFSQGFARGLGVRAKILSPTFVLLKKYPIGAHHAFFHVDCYRLEHNSDLDALGFSEIASDPRALVLLEWGDRMRRLLPKHRIAVKFSHAGRDKRRISVHSRIK